MPQPVDIRASSLAGIELLPFFGVLNISPTSLVPASGEVFVISSLIIAHAGNTNDPAYANIILFDGTSSRYVCYQRPIPQGTNYNVFLGKDFYLPYPWQLSIGQPSLSPIDTGHYTGSYAKLT